MIILIIQMVNNNKPLYSTRASVGNTMISSFVTSLECDKCINLTVREPLTVSLNIILVGYKL